MPSPQEEVLRQIKKETAKKSPPPDVNTFYALREVNKSKRWSFLVAMFFGWIILSIFLRQDMAAERHWLATLGPVMVIGGLITLIPIAEKWIYLPWQTQAQQYERHIIDRQ